MSRTRYLVSAAGSAFALLVGSPAAAQEGGFGEQRPFVLSLENLGGASYHRIEADDEAIDNLHVGVSSPSGVFPLIPGPLMRLGLHYFVSPPLSLGAILHYSDNDEFGEALFAGARIGAGVPLSDTTAVWARGGIAYFSQEYTGITLSDIRPGGEVLLVIQPVEHFGFMLGAMFEVGLAGTIEDEDGDETDYTYIQAGLTFGILADF